MKNIERFIILPLIVKKEIQSLDLVKFIRVISEMMLRIYKSVLSDVIQNKIFILFFNFYPPPTIVTISMISLFLIKRVDQFFLGQINLLYSNTKRD